MKSELRIGIYLIAVALMAAGVLASDSPAPAAADSALASLEHRAPTENQLPNLNPKFRSDLSHLIDSNTLSTGDQFYRAATLAQWPAFQFVKVRVRYELLLAATARGHAAAPGELTAVWDGLLVSIGRPQRAGTITFGPGSQMPAPDMAPECVAAVYRDPIGAAKRAAAAADNGEVRAIKDADQKVRKEWSKLSMADMQKVGEEDRLRAGRIREIIGSGGLRTATDFANASLVLQHSEAFASYELAHELAVCSLALGNRGIGRWLVAATYDRMLGSVGLEQRFGTQGEISFSNDEKPTVAETDERDICDNERLALGCPTLAAKRANFYTHDPRA